MTINNEDIVFFDIEAEPPNKNKDLGKVLQFGAIKLSKNNVVKTLNIFSNPGKDISRHVKKLVDKNIKKIYNGISQKEACEKIIKFIKNSTLISYGNFDYDFIKKIIKKETDLDVNEKFIDLQKKWQSFAKNKNVWSLKKLAIFFDINTDDEKFHDALYDSKLLYEIYLKWINFDENKLNEKIIENKLNTEKTTELKNVKKTNYEVNTINNVNKINGLCFLNINFAKIYIDNQKNYILTNLNLIETQNFIIKRNYSFFYDESKYDDNEYNEFLINLLKSFCISIRNKKILFSEKEHGNMIKILNLCAKKINMFPLNKIIFIDGIEKYENFINYNEYRFNENLDLIKKWLIYNYLKMNN